MSEKKKVKDAKKIYEKPAVVHRQIMESIAGACECNDVYNSKTGDPGYCDFCTQINS